MLADLAYITVAIAIFEASDDIEEIPPYVDIHRCIMLGEAMVLCKEALAAHGPLNTRQLALRVMAAKGLDTGDKMLTKAIAGRLIHVLCQQCRRGLIDGTDEKHLEAGCSFCRARASGTQAMTSNIYGKWLSGSPEWWDASGRCIGSAVCDVLGVWHLTAETHLFGQSLMATFQGAFSRREAAKP